MVDADQLRRKSVKRRHSASNVADGLTADKVVSQVLHDMVVCAYCATMGYPRTFLRSGGAVFCSKKCLDFYQILGPQQYTKLPTIDFNTVIGCDNTESATMFGFGKSKKVKTGIRERRLSGSYKWPLKKISQVAAPVQCFMHAPAALFWEQVVSSGILVEVENVEDDILHSCWVAKVEKILGYMGHMQYVGVKSKKSAFWLNLCSPTVHPVGWSAARGRPLVPPPSVVKHRTAPQWQFFLADQLTLAKTLPWTFNDNLKRSLESRFSPLQMVEVVDKCCLAQVKLATITLVSARRLMMSYYDNDFQDDGFTCHEDSVFLHPLGWAESVTHDLRAPDDYNTEGRRTNERYFKATTSRQFQDPPACDTEFAVGMRLEAIDPLNLSTICVATIKKVLKKGYMMIRIDSFKEDKTYSDWFCVHASSTSIFPAGFCKANAINIAKPVDFKGDVFDWPSYLLQTNSRPAHIKLRDVPDHGFEPGMLLEAVDLMKPHEICVASIRRVVGRLLRVHFEGWTAAYDQWMDCQSPDIFPVGWCDIAKVPLKGPPLAGKASLGVVLNVSPGKKGKKRNNAGSPKTTITLDNDSPGKCVTSVPKPPEVSPIPLITLEEGSVGERVASVLKVPELNSKPPTLTREESPVVHSQSMCQIITDVSAEPPQLSPAHVPGKSVENPAPPIFNNPDAQSSPIHVRNREYDGAVSSAGSDMPSCLVENEFESKNILSVVGKCPVVAPDSFQSASNEAGPSVGKKRKYGLVEIEKSGLKVGKSLSKADFWYEEEHPKILSTTTRSGKMIRHSTGTLSRHETDTKIRKQSNIQPISLKTPNSAVVKKKILRRKTSTDLKPPLAPTPPSTAPSYKSPMSVFTPLQFQAQDDRVIPRLVDHPAMLLHTGKLEPSKWNVRDVAQFLRVNDMEQFCSSFSQRKIDGPTLLNLTLDSIIHLTGKKVGPATHIVELVDLLKSKSRLN